MNTPKFHELNNGLRIAYRHGEAAAGSPTFVFLPGYMSDMDGGKATAVFDWAHERGAGCLLLDYSGCGKSGGEFADGTLSKWRGEVLDLIAARGIDRIVLVGSSMGGWLMLMVGAALGEKLCGMAGIASAPDFTEWGRSDADKERLQNGETVYDENPYGPDPTPMFAGFWADGQAHRLLGSEIAIDCPVRLLHGQRDQDVPWDISMQLARSLRSDDVQVTLIKDGDHRLSREQDIELLLDHLRRLLN